MAKKTAKKSTKASSRKKSAAKPRTATAAKKPTSKAPARRKTSKSRTSNPAAPTLLSGGNPQIAKADGDAPVQAYIAAMPGWKHDVGRRLDDLVSRTVPGVQKAVRWNTPFYGVGQGWFLAFHCITRYVKVTFFNGSSLTPPPPVTSKMPDVRYLHIHENDWGTTLDEAQLTDWIKQASRLPGDNCF